VFARDNADNDPYPASGFSPGLNGGFGFAPWTEPERGTVYDTFLGPAIDEGVRSWGLGGTYAMGRALPTAVLAGTWSFVAVHQVLNPANHGFSGFNLKSSPLGGFDTDELLRFGILPGEPDYSDTGIYVSIDRGLNYEFLDCGWTHAAGATIEYAVDWDGLGNYTLTARNVDEDVSAIFVRAMPAGAVSTLGSAVYGATLNEGLLFNRYTATPEPASALPFLAAIGVALALRHSRSKPAGRDRPVDG
jgi:hypothetical protein